MAVGRDGHRPIGARPSRRTVPDPALRLRAVPVLFERSSDEVFASVLDGQPDIRDALDAVSRAAWESVDPVLLELCRLRMATLFGCPAELAWRTPAAVAAGLEEERIEVLAHWPTSPRFGPRERACLAFAEQFVIDVAGLDDAIAGSVVEHLGEQGLADFASALLVVEQRLRLRLIWQRLFEPES
jgi:alkylhydroperoxidase family enzyme